MGKVLNLLNSDQRERSQALFKMYHNLPCVNLSLKWGPHTRHLEGVAVRKIPSTVGLAGGGAGEGGAWRAAC